jgi:hypothetical protein
MHQVGNQPRLKITVLFSVRWPKIEFIVIQDNRVINELYISFVAWQIVTGQDRRRTYNVTPRRACADIFFFTGKLLIVKYSECVFAFLP